MAIDAERLKAIAQEFFESEDGHEPENLTSNSGEDVTYKWLPEKAEESAISYLTRFAQFVLQHPSIAE